MNSKMTLSYFPGCSLATSARENNESLQSFFRTFDIQLFELEDWNCCGSSSAHSVNSKLSFQLSCRNLSLVPENRAMLVACPGCYLRLKCTHIHLKNDVALQREYKSNWGRSFDHDLRIIHFFELLDLINHTEGFHDIGRLKHLRIAPYYGCMLAHPPELKDHNFYGLMENIITSLGGTSVKWPYAARCCGTFLTVARPDIVTQMVEQIVNGAIDTEAECIVTACAMCHLNLEVRSPKHNKIPIFHFSEILALALGLPTSKAWFSRHLIDPTPLLEKKGMI